MTLIHMIFVVVVDHSNERVRELVKAYLNFLKNLGYQRWRFDFAKGYSPQVYTSSC